MPNQTKEIMNLDELEKLAENLEILMRNKGVDTRALHLATGISVSAINALKRAKGNPTLGTLLELSKYFNITLDELISHTNNAAPTTRNTSTVPIYTLQNVNNRYNQTPLKYISTECSAVSDEDLFGVEIHNNALSPFFDKGSIFLLSPKLGHTDGDIVLVQTDKKSLVFRKIYNRGDHPEFHSISLDAAVQTYKNPKLIGVVFKVIQPLY